MRTYFLLASLTVFVACQSETEAPVAEEKVVEVAEEMTEAVDSKVALAAILAAQPDEAKARYAFRNPQETIEFFGIEPGMTVLEGLPGGGWYTKVLLPYLGEDGCIIGVNYPLDLYRLFPFANEEFMARQEGFEAKFPVDAAEWAGEGGASVEAVRFGSLPEKFANTADAAFFPRVLHNPANFENNGGEAFLTQALADTFMVLKPGGVFGVVQHEARADMSDEFADGSHGYLKKNWLIQQIEAAGFEFVAESDINANPKDQPTAEDIVWRLPPTYFGTGEDDEMRAAVDAIGESNRMTLKFRKPL